EEELQTKPLAESIQRQEIPEEEEELQTKPLAESIQRQEMPEEEEELQMKPLVQRKSSGGGMAATPELEQSIASAKGSGQPIADDVRQPMEQAFGADLSGVKIHTDSKADHLNRSVGARAFTTGQDVFFRQGEYNPGSKDGQELMAHEFTHVLQQTASIQRKPEIEATEDAMGEHVVNQVNAINQGGTAHTGIHYAHNFQRRAQLYKQDPVNNSRYKEYADKWNDDYWNGYADPNYFERLGWMDWQLKPMTDASEGIKRWLTGGTIGECLTALIAIQIDTLRAAIGDDKFNERYSEWPNKPPGNKLLRISPNIGVTPLADGVIDSTDAAKNNNKGTPGNRPVKKGEWYYFYNHPKYLLKHPGGAFQGENAVCMDETPGNQLWAGFGVSSVTEANMLNEMSRAYNAMRTERDYQIILERFAADVLAEKNSGNTYQSLYDKYKTRIPDEYKSESSTFPDTVTVEDILNAPEYTIGGQTRKGGFLVSVGLALNPNKVQEIRNQ
ncbi:eCIS core domain-containing protein, partial [Coleofasciculus sp.]|uniref:eCIS core domain-containing protein n=1 Tax=Coleofasciculus sp. TaxID=3100458 RepID=UPI003A45F7D9